MGSLAGLRLTKRLGVTLLCLLGLLVLIIAGYWADWTGFDAYPPGVTRDAIETQREKTLWDWLDLLIVPVVLAVGGFLFNRAERQNERLIAERRTAREEYAAAERATTERKLADDALREGVLQTYLDRMSDLLLDKDPTASASDTAMRAVGRARTLTALRRLDGVRKGLLLRFVYESQLIMRDNPRLYLGEADMSSADLENADLGEAYLLRVNLRGANLTGANLSAARREPDEPDEYGAVLRYAILEEARMHRANLDMAELQEANLSKADLSLASMNGSGLRSAKLKEANLYRASLLSTNFIQADLSGADLREADMYGARLTGANLEGAQLSGALLSHADLSGAKVSNQQLADVGSLEGTTMPDGVVHS